MQGGFGRRAWWDQGFVDGGVDKGGSGCSRPSVEAGFWTEQGTGVFHSRSPIRWSSQMLSEKKSMPAALRLVDPGFGWVRASRWERRNMLDLPTVQGAMATVEMAV